MGYYYDNNSGQYIFDKSINGLWVAARWLIRGIVYFPLLTVGYALASMVLGKKDSAFAWMGMTLILAYALYLLIFFLKGMLLAFRHESHLVWIFLLVICIVFTCISPGWIVYQLLEKPMIKLSPLSGDIIAKIASFLFGLFVYTRYHFLSNVAPAFAFPAYRLGITIGFTLLKRKAAISAIKSNGLI